MPLKTDLNYVACTAKCKCLAGPRAGTIYECNSPCSEEFEIFDEYDCSCINAMDGGDYRYEGTITQFSDATGESFFTPVQYDFTLNANTLVGITALPQPASSGQVDFGFIPNEAFVAGRGGLTVFRTPVATGCTGSVQFQVQFQSIGGGNVVFVPLAGTVLTCSSASGQSASIVGAFSKRD